MAILYGIGVGPGDPELLTVKAMRLIQSCTVVAAPVSDEDGESYALSIIRSLLRPEQQVLKLHFPMVRDLASRIAKRKAAADAVQEQLDVGRDVAFVTEGDPMLHSTFGYLLDYVDDAVEVEIVPGVSSILAAAADAHVPLARANENIAILTGTGYGLAGLNDALRNFDTVVILKVYRQLPAVLETLKRYGLADRAFLVEQASHAQGSVIRNLASSETPEVGYLSLLIIRTGDDSTDEPSS